MRVCETKGLRGRITVVTCAGKTVVNTTRERGFFVNMQRDVLWSITDERTNERTNEKKNTEFTDVCWLFVSIHWPGMCVGVFLAAADPVVYCRNTTKILQNIFFDK